MIRPRTDHPARRPGHGVVGIKAEHNGNNGVRCRAGFQSPGPGISTTGNHSYGVSVVGQNHVEISNLTLAGDQAGGLDLNRNRDTTVHNITAADEPNGVFLHVNSTNVVLDAITVTGGRTGILAEKTTTGLHVTGSTIDSAHVAGMEIGESRHPAGRAHRSGRVRAAMQVERGAAGCDRGQESADRRQRRAGDLGWHVRASWSRICPPTVWATRCAA